MLLNKLRETPGRVVPQRELMELLWGDDADGGPLGARAALHALITQLRRNLEARGSPARIRNRFGDGYWLEE